MKNVEGVSGARHNNFDLIRLFAAGQVVVLHASEHMGVPDNIVLFLLGYFPGVPTFFFVSGFLVSKSLERSSSLVSFYRKRFLRIYPALWACLLFSTVLAAMFVSLPILSTRFFAWLAAQLTIVQFYNPDFLRGFGLGTLNGSLWTIPVELQFYFALPVIYFLGRNLGKSFYWGLAVAALLLHTIFLTAFYHNGTMIAKFIMVTLAPWLGFFMIGVLAQQYWHKIAGLFHGKLWLWLASYAVIATVFTQFAPNMVTGNRINAVCGIALAGVVLSAAYTRPAISQKLLRGNDISYGTYLYHAPFINLFVQLQKENSWHIDGVSTAVLICVLTVIAAILSWNFVERPALELKRASGRENEQGTVHNEA